MSIIYLMGGEEMDIDESHKDIGVDSNSELIFLENDIQDRRWDLPESHYHEVYEILICIEAEDVTCFAQSNVFEMKRGSVFVFSPFSLHRTSTSENSVYRRAIVYFRASDIDGFTDTAEQLLSVFCEPFSHTVLSDRELNEVLDILHGGSVFEGSGYMEDEKNRIKLLRLLMFLNEKLVSGRETKHDYAKFGELNRILDHIQLHIKDKELTLALLSQKFFRSEASINSMFKKYIGYTVKEYIILKRIDIAQELLRGGATVAEACKGSGFNNYSHFIRTFSRLTGVTPKKYAYNAVET